MPVYNFNENDSDSGEDFDYGEEEYGEEEEPNIDLLEYINNMDVSNF